MEQEKTSLRVDNTEIPTRLRWWELISINLYWFALNIRNQVNGKIFQPYLVALFVPLGYANTALGGLNTAGLIIAMLAQPVFGILSDRNTSHFGRRRPYIFIGTILDTALMVLLLVVGSYWALVLLVLLQQFSANISHGALQGLIPDMAPEEQRESASSIKAIFELLPTVITGITIAQLVKNGQFTLAVFVSILAILILLALTMVFVKEKPISRKPDVPLAPALIRVLGIVAGIGIGSLAGILLGGLVGGVFGLVAMTTFGLEFAIAVLAGLGGVIAMIVAVVVGVWTGTRITLGKEALENRSFSWWIVNRLLFLAAVTSIPVFAPYFLMYSFKLDIQEATGRTGLLTSIVGVFLIISALGVIWIAKIMSQKSLMILCGVLAALSTVVLVSTVWFPNMLLIYLAGLILGIAAGLFFPTNWALGTSLTPVDQAGRYLGISNLAGAGAGMIGTGIGGLMTDVINIRFPGVGWMVLFSSYFVLFLLSAVVIRWINKK